MKVVFTFFLCLTVYIQGLAQYASYGAALGLGHSWVSGIKDNMVYNPSFSAGGTMQYAASGFLGFGAEIKFSSEGYKYTYDQSDRYTRVASEYLRVPLKAILFLTRSTSNVRPKITAGPGFGFLLGGKMRMEDSKGTEYYVKIKDLYNAFDFGVQTGAGVDIRLGHDTWLISELVYYHGFLKQNKAGYDAILNRNLVMHAGITFDL